MWSCFNCTRWIDVPNLLDVPILTRHMCFKSTRSSKSTRCSNICVSYYVLSNYTNNVLTSLVVILNLTITTQLRSRVQIKLCALRLENVYIWKIFKGITGFLRKYHKYLAIEKNCILIFGVWPS